MLPPSRMIAGAVLLVGAAPAFAQDMARLPPEPPAALRDLTTDRPDTTESPFTVDAGHVQIETTILAYSLGPRGDSGRRGDRFDLGVTNIRIGLTPDVEVDLGFQPVAFVSDDGAGRRAGVGAVVVRAKYNIVGNAGGGAALALLPYVTIPIDRGSGVGPDAVEVGLIVPPSLPIGGRFGLGLNAGITAAARARGGPLRIGALASASLAIAWSGRLGSYHEVAGAFDDETIVSVNNGLTWKASDSLQFDAGVGIGVTRDSDAVALFVGISIRY